MFYVFLYFRKLSLKKYVIHYCNKGTVCKHITSELVIRTNIKWNRPVNELRIEGSRYPEPLSTRLQFVGLQAALAIGGFGIRGLEYTRTQKPEITRENWYF